jgi:lipopolysaccharide export LptBFGC system permease protein LptF
MNWLILLYIAVLFFVLTPGILVSLPPGSGKFKVAAFHAVVFALVYHFTNKIVGRLGESYSLSL